MSIETYVRFRPVEPLDKSGGDPVRKARERWTAELERNVDVISFSFPTGRRGVLIERDEAKAGNRPWVDITISWTSIDKATATFGNNALFEYLCGYVTGAPTVVVEDQSELMGKVG